MMATSSLLPAAFSGPEAPPSFFEVYASQYMNAALRPAVRFALDVLALRHSWLRPLANYSDEIFTTFLLLVEATQLSRHSSLLSESFYSLCRSPSNSPSSSSSSSFSRSRIIVSLLLDVIFPYIRVKLDALHSQTTGGVAAALFEPDEQQHDNNSYANNNNRNAHQPRPTLHSFSIVSVITKLRSLVISLRNTVRIIQQRDIRAILIRYYPKLRASVDLLNILTNLFYLYGYTRHFSLSLFIQRLELRRSTNMDALRLVLSDRLREMSSPNSFSLSTIADRALTVLKATFVGSIVAFRFLQIYYAAETSAPRETTPSIPPPDRLEPADGINRRTALTQGLCPLCFQTRVNSTACLTSGYVFCYLCIVAHVQQANKCPVTLAPTTVDDLVRVYEQDL